MILITNNQQGLFQQVFATEVEMCTEPIDWRWNRPTNNPDAIGNNIELHLINMFKVLA